MTLFSRGILCTHTDNKRARVRISLAESFISNPSHLLSSFRVDGCFCDQEIWQSWQGGKKNYSLKNILFLFLVFGFVVESRLPDVLMSVWDVAKQASSVVTMALHCRCYGFLICRMWFNQACHILFWSLSAGLLLMVTTT